MSSEQKSDQPAKARLAPVPDARPAAPAEASTTVKMTEPGPARLRPRHWVQLFSFLLMVLVPSVVGTVYLYRFAADQYHSTIGFSVHSEEAGSPLDILGSITQSGKSSASDIEVLYEYIRSQQMVVEVSKELNLTAMYNRPENDPVFTIGPEPSIEDLHWYWGWMVSVSYDGSTGIIEVEARAFTPEDAHAIAEVILRRSTALINELSQEARDDAIRFAQQDLTEAEDRLRQIRRKLRSFRDVEQIIDPTADVQQRMGLLTALEAQLAAALVTRDVLLGQTTTRDSRVRRLDDEIAAINRQIDIEKAKLGTGSIDGALEAERMAEIVGIYEELVMDREFAEQAYAAVLASFEEARTEARRQHRYLATHVGPTLAQDALYPRRWMLSLALVLFSFIGWLVLVLIVMNVRDNR